MTREDYAMTPKENIKAFVERMPDDVTMEQVFYKLELFIGVQTGLEQIERGEGIDHDELFDELLKTDAEEKDNLVTGSQKRPSRHKEVHRPGLAKNGTGVHKTAKKVHK
jgi:hypothetical protein